MRDNRAIGVQLAEPAEIIYADSVILAAGTYGSPSILLRSGIGPAPDLRDLGIEVSADFPGVGGNLQDHSLLYLQYATPDRVLPVRTQIMLTCNNGPAQDQVSLHLFPHGPIPSETGPVLCLLVGVMQPLSRGRLKLASRDPRDAPQIDLALLSHPEDVNTMIAGVKLVRRIAASAPLKDHLLAEKWPGTDVNSNDGIAAASRASVVPYNHSVGTCRMGPNSDPDAVVDSLGAVNGVAGLYIADASIMPTIPATNTNLPTIMLAERIASSWS
jgi:choline dehydrogenase